MCGLSVRRAVVGLLFLAGASPGLAQDTLRIAGGLAGTWENSFSELGQNAGFFGKDVVRVVERRVDRGLIHDQANAGAAQGLKRRFA